MHAVKGIFICKLPLFLSSDSFTENCYPNYMPIIVFGQCNDLD